MPGPIKLIYESSPLGTAGGLFNLPVNKPGKFLIMNCDIISDLRLSTYSDTLQRTNVIFLWRLQSLLINCHSVVSFDKRYNFKGIREANPKILCLIFFFFLGKHNFIDVSDLSKDEAIDMPELINRAYARGHTVNMFPIHEP